MCLIIVCPPGHTPGREVLEETMKQNKDGSGWVMKGPKETFLAHKSATDTDKVLESFLAARKSNPQTWCLWHSRIATRGTKGNDDNVHPFRVPNRPWMMAHNGSLDLYDLPMPGDVFCHRSDSRIFAEDCLPNWHWTDMLAQQEDLEKYIGTSKIVVISSQREKKRPVLILNESKGTWDKDDHCWYSHTIYVSTFNRTNHYSGDTYFNRPPGPNTEWAAQREAREAAEKERKKKADQEELDRAVKALTEIEGEEETYVADWAAIAKAVENGNAQDQDELEAGVC
jgi:predicted glutamine amidotransferase